VDGLAVELNDAALTWVGGGNILASEPGFALLNGDGVVTGSAAVAQAHLEPRLCRNRYWDELSTKLDTDGRTYAELAFLQFHSMVADLNLSGANALLVTPGHYDREQLGLVLGIVQECGLNATGLLQSAAVASTRPWPGRQLIHLDVGLHRLSVAAMGQSEFVHVEQEAYLPDMGLAAMMNRWAHRVSELFVIATRFDPSHHAESEQKLFDALPQWVEQLRSQEQLQVDLDGHDLLLERSQFVSALDDYFRALGQVITETRTAGSAAVLQLSDRLAGVPGLVEYLRGLEGCEVVTLPRDHSALAALSASEHIAAEQGGLRLTRQLPWREKPHSQAVEDPVVTPVAATEPAATHLVYSGLVHAVAAELVIGRGPGPDRAQLRLTGNNEGVSAEHCEVHRRGDGLWLRDLSRYGTTVNRQRVAGEIRLRPGDEIQVGSQTLMVVAMAEPDEA
jgi:hypothetical protein